MTTKNNLQEHLNWFLKEHPFQVPNRQDVPVVDTGAETSSSFRNLTSTLPSTKDTPPGHTLLASSSPTTFTNTGSFATTINSNLRSSQPSSIQEKALSALNTLSPHPSIGRNQTTMPTLNLGDHSVKRPKLGSAARDHAAGNPSSAVNTLKRLTPNTNTPLSKRPFTEDSISHGKRSGRHVPGFCTQLTGV